MLAGQQDLFLTLPVYSLAILRMHLGAGRLLPVRARWVGAFWESLLNFQTDSPVQPSFLEMSFPPP